MRGRPAPERRGDDPTPDRGVAHSAAIIEYRVTIAGFDHHGESVPDRQDFSTCGTRRLRQNCPRAATDDPDRQHG